MGAGAKPSQFPGSLLHLPPSPASSLGTNPTPCQLNDPIIPLHLCTGKLPLATDYARSTRCNTPLRQAFSDVFPHLVAATNVPKLVKIDDVNFADVDAVFCCLPHATTQVGGAGGSGVE